LEFGFYRGGGGCESGDDEEEDKDDGDGIAGILKNPNALTDSRYAAGVCLQPRIDPAVDVSDTSLTDFEQLERLGQGGFGTVYKVRNKLDGRIYAVKRVLLSSKDPALSERVLREARIPAVFVQLQVRDIESITSNACLQVLTLSRLTHTHIVRYYQVSQHLLCLILNHRY
jgi:serine/threonine protein kinase